jgi:hypothetical protein
MNLRNLRDRIVSSMLAIGVVGSLVGLGSHSVSAQSITATMPFPFCVNNQAYLMGNTGSVLYLSNFFQFAM